MALRVFRLKSSSPALKKVLPVLKCSRVCSLRMFSDKSIPTQSEEACSGVEKEAKPSTVEEIDYSDVTYGDMQIKVKEQRGDMTEWRNKCLLQYADMENLRKRSILNSDEAKKSALQNFSKDLLEVVDTLFTASNSVAAEIPSHNEESSLRVLHDGVTSTQRILQKVMEKHGVKQIDCAGKVDPKLHSVLSEVEDETKEEGSIHRVVKEGYSWNERVLRVAEVDVVKSRS